MGQEYICRGLHPSKAWERKEPVTEANTGQEVLLENCECGILEVNGSIKKKKKKKE